MGQRERGDLDGMNRANRMGRREQRTQGGRYGGDRWHGGDREEKGFGDLR